MTILFSRVFPLFGVGIKFEVFSVDLTYSCESLIRVLAHLGWGTFWFCACLIPMFIFISYKKMQKASFLFYLVWLLTFWFCGIWGFLTFLFVLVCCLVDRYVVNSDYEQETKNDNHS